MAASVRAFNSANVTQFTTATTSVSAAKPNGLAVGDIWLIHHARRGTGAATATPAGFSAVGGTLTGAANHIVRTYYKIATSGDVAGGATSWTQDVSAVTMTQSFAISAVNPTTIFDAESPVDAFDAAATTSHPNGGITPDANGLVLIFATMPVTATTWSAPTTQGGGWTLYSDNQQDAGTNTSRISIAAAYLARTQAAGATGSITMTSTASQQASIRVLHVNDAATNVQSTLLPDGVAAKGGYRRTTTANITRVQGDPDLSGGLGFSSCPFGVTLNEMSTYQISAVLDCFLSEMGACPVGLTLAEMGTYTLEQLSDCSLSGME